MSDNTIIAVGIMAAYITNNSVPAADMPDLIRAVIGTLNSLGKPTVVAAAAPKLVPAVAIRKSIRHDFIVSLENGERYQTLRRHLSGLGMTPSDYRRKWGLPDDYPMVAVGYSIKRSQLARSLGLGRKPAEPTVAPAKSKRARLKGMEQAAFP